MLNKILTILNINLITTKTYSINYAVSILPNLLIKSTPNIFSDQKNFYNFKTYSLKEIGRSNKSKQMNNNHYAALQFSSKQ